MFNWLKRWLRPKLSSGERYVEDTEGGQLYLAMWKRCPNCWLEPPVWIEGPSGGLSTNIFCGRCGEGYNVTPMIGIADKIGKQKDYILPEYQGEKNDGKRQLETEPGKAGQ